MTDFKEKAEKHQDFAQSMFEKMASSDYTEADALTLLVGMTAKILSYSAGEQLEEKLETVINALKVSIKLYKDVNKEIEGLFNGDV